MVSKKARLNLFRVRIFYRLRKKEEVLYSLESCIFYKWSGFIEELISGGEEKVAVIFKNLGICLVSTIS